MRLGALGAGDRVADIVVLSSLLRLGTFFLLVTIPQFVPSWDTSARPLLPASTHVEGLLRWDTLHFVGIAEREDGKHEVEKEWAFGRGIVEVLRIGEKIMAPWKAGDDSIEVRRERMVVGGSVLASAASMASGVVLYQLTLDMTGDRRFARTTLFLHSLTPAPSTLVIPYTEPFFALLSFSGSLFHSRRWRLVAALSWAGSTWFRQLGLVNAGFFIWEWLCETQRPRHERKLVHLIFGLIRAVVLAAVVVAPFAHSQRDAFVRFCVDAPVTRPWCDRLLPFAYTWAQEHYWDVGFLKYWVPKQIPLFVMSAPVYALLIWTLRHYFTSLSPSFLLPSPSSLVRATALRNRRDPLLDPVFAPHAYLTLFLTATLLFHSHVQIVLRQVFTMPMAWWGAAALVNHGKTPKGRDWVSSDSSTQGTKNGPVLDSNEGLLGMRSSWTDIRSWTWGEAWVRWCLVWGSISILLWATFLPPA